MVDPGAASAPIFTAVIPAFNAEDTLASAIRSVLDQTRSDLELIVVDDGSRDGTADVARSFQSDPRVGLVRQPNRGLAGARNAGIAKSQGRYIGFLDSDDLWMPNYLEVLGDALDADQGAGFAYTDGWTLDDETRRIRRTTTMAHQRPPNPPPYSAEEFLRVLVRRNFILAEALVRRATLDAVGGFCEGLPAVEDYELWLRILANGYRAVRPPGLLLIRRDREGSMSRDLAVMYKAMREVWGMVVEQHPAPDDVKATARARMRAMDRELAVLEGRNIPLREARRARDFLASVRRRLLDRRLWYERPPAEVAGAFPDLQDV